MTDFMKIVIAGECNVGKTNIIGRFVNNTFDRNISSTIGIDYIKKNLQIFKRDVNLLIFDTAGQEKFRAVSNTMFRGATAVILVYDITNFESFEKINFWLDEVKKYSLSSIPICLIGNKIDLENDRMVKTEIAARFAQQNALFFFETSAADDRNGNISIAFECLVKKSIDVNIRETFSSVRMGPMIINKIKEEKEKEKEKEKESKCGC
jgi:small GTP-binding protein